MPIEVNLPDGNSVEFPDGTPTDIMEKALSQYVSGNQAGGAATPSTPAQEGSAGRSFALGTRNVLEGLGGLAGSVVNPFANSINAALGGDPNYFKNPGAAASDLAGLPTAQNGGERMAGAAIEGAAGALPTLGAGLAMQGARALPASAQAIGKVLADMPRLQMASGFTGGGAMGMAQEGGAGPVWQMAAGLAGGVVPMSAGAVGRGIKNSLAGLINTEKANAFKAAGYTPPSLGTVSDSGAVQALEGGLSQIMPSAGIMKRARDAGNNILAETIEKSADDLANGASVPRSLEKMGDIAVQGAEASKAAFKETAKRFEDTIYAPIGRLSVEIDNIIHFIDEQAKNFSPAFADVYRTRMLKELGPIIEDARPRATLQGQPITEAELQSQPFLKNMVESEPGPLNVASLRYWRSDVGERMKPNAVASTGDARQGELKQLYANASEDIEAALPPEDLPRVREYNKWFSGESNMRESVDKTFFRNKDATATAKAILTAESNQLKQLRSVVGEEKFNQLQAGALRELARGQNQGYSPAYVTESFSEGRSGLQPEVREELFAGREKHARDIAQALVDSKNATNTSNTAGANWANSFLGGGAAMGLFFNPLASAAAVATPYAVGRAVTSPKNINRLIERAFNPIQVNFGNMFNAVTAPGREENLQQMLNRMGISTSLDKK